MAARETGDPGRVAGRERRVFRGRGRGTSALDPKGDWPAPPEGPVPGLGDAWAPGPPATPEGLWGAPGAASPSDSDGPGCLCPRRALAPSRPNCPAGCWWEGSWARVAHPPARLASRRAGEPPGRVGDEEAQRGFFDARLAWVADMEDGTAGASAGPPDPSRTPPAAIPDHDGEAGEECRLTYVPGAAGNATPGRTFAELGAAGLPASWAVPGAGRWSAGNARATGGAGTRFPAGPGPNVRAHGDVVAERPASVREADEPVARGGRQRIEQVFDVGRSHASLLPPRVRSEEAPGGHLPPALCATAPSCRPRPGIPARAPSMPQALAAARNQRREACDDKAVTCEPTSAANELHRAIGAKCPVEVPFVCGKN